MCQGWLEGYLLTGRHGFFSCYEAFIHIIDSMVNQHAKWLKTTREIPWRKPIASLNYLLSSLVWRQDHNGFSHQDPGFIDHLMNKKADVVRIYLPPDANTLLSVAITACAAATTSISLLPANSPPRSGSPWTKPSSHCTTGLGVWPWASNDEGRSGRGHRMLRRCAHDGGAGRGHDSARANPRSADPRGERRRPDDTAAAHRNIRTDLPDEEYDSIFPPDTPVHICIPRISVAHSPAHLPPAQPRQPPRARLQGRRHHDDAVRYVRAQQHRPLPVDARCRCTACRGWPRRSTASASSGIPNSIQQHRLYVAENGDDLPEIKNWRWPM